MKIAINKNGPVPAYQQVVEGITSAIRRGDVGQGTRLPSVRSLAVDLGLNVNTIARAYRDLERAGVIDTRPGMGTFVAAPGSPDRRPHRPIPATGGPTAGLAPFAQPATWRDLLGAARALAASEGVEDEAFLASVREVLQAGPDAASILVVAASAIEAADLLRVLPPEVAALAASVDLEAMAGRVQAGGVAGILTTFPSQPRVRARLGDAAVDLAIIPLETQLTEATVRALAGLPSAGRLALVTLEKSHWDHEANDVMRIIGRSRWLKMILLGQGGQGLDERLDQVEIVLHVPGAAEVLSGHERQGCQFVQLERELTARARARLLAELAPGIA